MNDCSRVNKIFLHVLGDGNGDGNRNINAIYVYTYINIYIECRAGFASAR
jgi:hypothetical protein